MKIITSLQNSIIKDVVALHDVKGRKKFNKCIFQGLRTILTALNSDLKLDKIFVTENNLSKIAEFIDAEKIVLINENVAKKISTVQESSGIIATFFIPEFRSINELGPGLVLAQINDPGNMGTLIRTAAACAVKNVVLVEGVDPWSPKVIQASAGTIALVNLFKVTWEILVSSKKNLQLCGLVVQNGISIKNISKIDSLIIVGNEAHGLPNKWQNDCDKLITLPMPGNTESLNASVAGSIAIYLTYVLKA